MVDKKIFEALGEYFRWAEKSSDDELPITPIPDGATSKIFVGDEDNGWVRWRPCPKDEIFDLSELEKNAKTLIHQSIKDLLNSWWFCQLNIEFGEYQFEIFPIIPGNYKAAFLTRLLGYKRSHEGKIEYIPIGFSADDDYMLVLKNSTGEIFMESVDTGEYKIICGDLMSFLVNGN